MSPVGWLDLGAGAAGDMLLGALVGAGVPLEVFRDAVAPLGLPIGFTAEPVGRAGLAAVRVHVSAPETGQPRRTYRDVRELLGRLPDGPVRFGSERAFAALAAAEGRVHGHSVDEVHFHEVGALDAIADVVGVVAGMQALALAELTASPIALGGGSAASAHGRLPVPVPAVLELLRAGGAPAAGGSPDELPTELCTPTGAALVTTLATGYGPLPALTPTAVGLGAGSRDLPDRPNVVRLVVGETLDVPGQLTRRTGADSAEPAAEDAVLLEANVDDLDPRLWPEVLAALLADGAADAWLVPILMKKGRPAHTLSVLCAPADLARLRTLVYRHTSTLGVRERAVTKRPLDRDVRHVEVGGRRIAVKRGLLPDGTVVTVQPEWEDVAAAAQASGLAARELLARASAAARDA